MSKRNKAFYGLLAYLTLCSVFFGVVFSDVIITKILLGLGALLLAQIVALYLLLLLKGEEDD